MAHPTPLVRRALAGLAGATLVVLGGCSDSTGIVATYDSGGGPGDSLLSGTLSITDTCVTVDGADGVTTPAFTGVVDVSGGVLHFHGAEYADGAKIELGGDDATDAATVTVPKGCPTTHVFLVADD